MRKSAEGEARCGCETVLRLARWKPASLFLLLLIGLSPSGLPSAQTGASNKHVIYYGWGLPDSLYFRERWQELEQLPFDGVGIAIPLDRAAWASGRRDTKNQAGWQVMGEASLPTAALEAAAEDLRTPRWSRARHDFLPVALSSGVSARGLHWFDDARWGIIARNFGALARLARVGNLRGLIVDPEHYNYSLFSYREQRALAERPFEEFRAAARQRGREVMKAVAAELPDVVLLFLFGHSLPLNEMARELPPEHREYALLADFYDGILEEMPEEAQFVDGFEFSYPYRQREQFEAARVQIRERAVAATSRPEDFRRRVRAGFGLWLDYNDRKDYRTPADFAAAVRAALESSDGYVWIYAHKFSFFPPAEDARPFLAALQAARAKARP